MLENTEAERVQEEVVSVHSLVEIEACLFCFEYYGLFVLTFGLLNAFNPVKLLDWHKSWSVIVVANFERLKPAFFGFQKLFTVHDCLFQVGHFLICGAGLTFC